MEKIDPEWLRSFMPTSGLNAADFSIEYPRCRSQFFGDPAATLSAAAAGTSRDRDDNEPEGKLPPGNSRNGVGRRHRDLRAKPASRAALSICESMPDKGRFKAQTIVRDANTQARVFEVVDMDLEERAKLRKLLVQLGNALEAIYVAGAQPPRSSHDQVERHLVFPTNLATAILLLPVSIIRFGNLKRTQPPFQYQKDSHGYRRNCKTPGIRAFGCQPS